MDEIITKKLTNHKFKKDDIEFEFVKPTKVKGEAQVNIRKGKQILCYEYSAEVDWRADTDADECDGTFKIGEISESDDQYDVGTLLI
jgi:activator of HSP90 ATPase